MSNKLPPPRATMYSILSCEATTHRRTSYSTRLVAPYTTLHIRAAFVRGSVLRDTVIISILAGRPHDGALMARRARPAVFFWRGSCARRVPAARHTSTPKP
jgi:hypothetical protein